MYLTDLQSVRSPHNSNKKRRLNTQISPVLQVLLKTDPDKDPKSFTALLDSGASSTVVSASCVNKQHLKTVQPTVWNTANGSFETTTQTQLVFKLPELNEHRVINHMVHVSSRHLTTYDIIIGRDLLSTLGIILNFDSKTVHWDNGYCPMKATNTQLTDYFVNEDNTPVGNATARIKGILDAKYAPADLKQVASSNPKLTSKQQAELLQVLQRYKHLFDGNLGTWTGSQYNIELKEGATPYHARAFPVPRIHERTLRLEIDRLCKLGVLKKVNRSEWAAPTFIIPKKDGTVRVISDFRELNKRIKRKPFPIPKIQDLLLKLEGFQYATSLDLNMGYYHIELTPFSKRLCTFVLPWGKYEYQRLPMGLCNSPDIFQEKMSHLMEDFEFVRAYIDDLLILTKTDWHDHLVCLDKVLNRLQQAGLKVNANKSFFGRDQLEYLGYWISRHGVQPLPQKVAAIHNLKPPKTKKQLRSFIGMINYYRDMWLRRSHLLQPLTALTSKLVPWKWTAVEQKAFDTIKTVISRETLLHFPDFNQPFDIHTDASHTQLGAVISQNSKPIAFYSRKLSAAQTRYTTTERELLSIVETLKEFRNILLGQQIRVYTDHKNLTCKNFNTDRVMRWRLILEEYSPKLLYVPGTINVVADALSRLDITTTSSPQPTIVANALAAGSETINGLEELPEDAFPLTYKHIAAAQQLDTALLNKLKHDSNYTVTTFHGGGKKRSLITHFNKIVLPVSLQQHAVNWYHTILCHPGETRTEQTLRQHFTFKGLRDMVHATCKKCDTCQRTKKNKKHYGHLPPKQAEVSPWEVLCVDLIGPYLIKQKEKENLTLHCVTMIDPATGWFEMKEIPNKRPDEIANIVEQTWFTRYPWPNQIIFDRGTEFMAEFATTCKNEYGITTRPITARNPQANSIIERVHQTIGNIIRTMEIYDQDLDKDNPFGGLLSATMFAVRSTYNTTTQATPMQLVFGRDGMFNIPFKANWDYIRQRKQTIINQNNQKENKRRIQHDYQVGDKILVKNYSKAKYGQAPYVGPFRIVQVNDNGTLRYRKDNFTDIVNIRNAVPYHE